MFSLMAGLGLGLLLGLTIGFFICLVYTTTF